MVVLEVVADSMTGLIEIHSGNPDSTASLELLIADSETWSDASLDPVFKRLLDLGYLVKGYFTTYLDRPYRHYAQAIHLSTLTPESVVS